MSAARGPRNLLIEKSHQGTVTRTSVRMLDESRRREEIARMLSGAEVTDEARAQAERIIGMDIRGHTVRRVLVEEASDIAAEYYVAILHDRASKGFLAMASAEGGVDIEEVAATKPEAIVKVPGLRSAASAIGTPCRRRASTGGFCVSFRT